MYNLFKTLDTWVIYRKLIKENKTDINKVINKYVFNDFVILELQVNYLLLYKIYLTVLERIYSMKLNVFIYLIYC